MSKLKEMIEQAKTHSLEFSFREIINGFECQIYVNKVGLGKGEGKKKKDAKQLAAQETINMLQCDPDIQQKHKMFRQLDYVNQLYHYCQSNNIERIFYKEIQASKDYYIIECNCQGQIRTQGMGVAYQKAMNFAAFKMLQILESKVKIEQIEQSPIKIDLDNCAIQAINTLSLNSNDYQFFQDFLVQLNDIDFLPLGSFMTKSMRIDKPLLDLAINIYDQPRFNERIQQIKDIIQLELDGQYIKFGVKSTKNNKLKILVQENLMANIYFVDFSQPLDHHIFMEPYFKICQWNRNASETLMIVHLWRQDSGLLIENDIFDFLVVCLTNGFQLNVKPINLLRQLIFQLQHSILNDIETNPYIIFQSQYHINLIKQLGNKNYIIEIAQQWDLNKIGTLINRF